MGAIAGGILLLELGLTRLLSVTTWYHFAFFSISLALMGLGASGVFVYVARQRLQTWPTRRLLVLSAAVFGITSIVLMVLFLYTPLAVASMTGDLWALVAANLAGIAPFFSGGVFLTVAITRFAHSVTKVYAADLFGAAAGCLILIPALTILGGPGPLLIAASIGGITAAAYSASQWRVMTIAFAGVAIALIAIQAFQPALDIHYEKGGRIRPSTFSAWNSYSRVAVYDEPHPEWGLSSTVDVEPAESLRMDIDSSASTAILTPASRDEVDFLRYDISSLGHWLLDPEARTLIIGPGGGRDIWASLVFGAASVTGVEVNSIIVDEVMRDEFFDASSRIYGEPGVEVVVDDGRNFIARSDTEYDLIQASLVDTWAATSSGAFSLSESNLYTVEAFAEYLEHLSADGVLSVSRWTAGSLRLVTLARAAFDQLSWGDVAGHLFVAASPPSAEVGGVANVVVTRAPLTEEDILLLVETSERLGFEVLYAPGQDGSPPSGNETFVALAAMDDLNLVVAGLPEDASPVTDDKPFFFQTRKIDSVGDLLDADGAASGGIQLTFRLLLLSVALVALFILLPLRFGTDKDPKNESPKLRLLPYFGLLGIGFIVMEIGLIQRFVLFLGHPVYSLTVVLFTFLLGAGLGSALSRQIADPTRAARVGLVGTIVLGLLYAVVLPVTLGSGLGLDRPVRIVISFAILLPLAVLMGMPLPSGIRVLSGGDDESVIPWAWGMNGAASVVGSATAVLLALTIGFTGVTVVAALIYSGALATQGPLRRRAPA